MNLTCEPCLEGNTLRCKGRGCARYERERSLPPKLRAPSPRRATTPRKPSAPKPYEPVEDPNRPGFNPNPVTFVPRPVQMKPKPLLPLAMAEAIHAAAKEGQSVDDILERLAGTCVPTRQEVYEAPMSHGFQKVWRFGAPRV